MSTGAGDGQEPVRRAAAPDADPAAQKAAARIFDLLVQKSPDSIVRLDRGCRHLYANPAAQADMGMQAAGLVGKTHHDLGFKEETARKYASFVRRVFETGVEQIEELHLTMPTGSLKCYETRGVPERSEDGQVESVLLIHRDLTERRTAEEAVAGLQAQLLQSRRMEAVARLAGKIAHDFTNMLTSIIGFSELIALQKGLDRNVVGWVTEIVQVATRAASLAQQLHAFSRGQSSRMHVVDLNKAVERAVRSLQSMIGEGISVMPRLAPSIGRISADPRLIEQLTIDLALNARDAMPDGGVLAIETRAVLVDEDFCRLHRQARAGSFILLAVSDTGIGMDEAAQSRLFEPAFTPEEQEKRPGLGMSIVQGIVKQCGGFISVDSAPGAGTTISVYLPLAAPSEA